MKRSLGLKIVFLFVFGIFFLRGQYTTYKSQQESTVSPSQYAYISFDIHPPECNMTVDGNAVYHKDNVLKLPSGGHEISLKCFAYYDMDFHVDLITGDTLQRKIFLLPFSGDLRLFVHDVDIKSEIYRDGVLLTSFKGNGGLNKAKTGEYVIRVSDGVNALTDTIMIYKDKMLQRTYTRQNLLEGYIEKQEDNSLRIRTSSLCLDISGAYSVYEVPQNNLMAEVSVSREVKNQNNRLNFGAKMHYYSPYVYMDPEGIVADQNVTDQVLLGGFLSWRGLSPSSFLGLGYDAFGGICYDFNSMSYQAFYDIPLFYFCPTLVLGDTLTNLSIRPYVRHMDTFCMNRCEVCLALTLTDFISIYVKGDCHIPADYLPDDVRVHAGARFNLFSKEKVPLSKYPNNRFFIQPAVKHVVCNDGFWSQGSGMGAFLAYSMSGGIRCGVDALICTARMNADFSYVYQGSLRLDLPLMLNRKNYITPSVQCGLTNQNYGGELYFGPFVGAGLYYERHFTKDHMITAGISLPLKFSEITNIEIYRFNTIVLSLGIGLNI